MALANSIAALAAIKAAIRDVIRSKWGEPGTHFADYAKIMAANWPPTIQQGGKVVQIIFFASVSETYYLHFTQTAADGVKIEWGDGTVETVSEAGTVNPSHQYELSGVYKVELTINEGSLTLERQCLMDHSAETWGNAPYFIIEAYVGGHVKIGDWAFHNAYGMTRFFYATEETELGANAFNGCTKAEIYFTSKPTTIGEGAFVQTGMTSFTFNSETAEVPAQGFTGCERLKTVNFVNVTRIGSLAFNGCKLLSFQALPASVKQIDSVAFINCISLTDVTLPAALTQIAYAAFSGCYGMKTLTILAETPPTLGTSALPDSLTAIYVPAESVDAYKAATNWNAFADRIFAIEE